MENLTHLEVSAATATLTLTRADKRNALKRETLQQLAKHLETIRENNDVRVLVLAAEGTVFCAGMDLGEMQERADSSVSKQEWHRDSEIYCEVLQRLYSLRIPTIAAVGGPAVAGGVGLVLACDLVVASQNASFMLPEPMRGITAAMVTPLLIHRVGGGPATSLLLSGEKWTAERAFDLGLCHDVVPAERFVGRVQQLIVNILSGSREALAITKEHVSRMTGGLINQQLTDSMAISAIARETADAREGLQAFLEKRNPNWQPLN
jgi:methylglutaconyl-CoA hydratase